MSSQHWEVVGGEGKGGILVREGLDLKSAQCETRLATGSVVVEKQLEGDRLEYDLVKGSGPSRGWVSLSLKDKQLLVKTEAPVQKLSTQDDVTPTDIIERTAPDRKLRVLALHGGGSNTNIMEYQTSTLRNTLNKRLGGTSKDMKTEWVFLNGAREWTQAATDDDKFMKAIAKGMPYKGWYKINIDDDSDRPTQEKLFDLSVKYEYVGVQEAADRVLEHVEAEGPFDVIVGFSQGCIITHLMNGILRSRGQEPPWKLSLFFNGMRVRDQTYAQLFEEKLKLPAVMVFGKKDEYYSYGHDSQISMYENPTVMEHEEGHKFPTLKPRANEVYEEVINCISLHTGFKLT